MKSPNSARTSRAQGIDNLAPDFRLEDGLAPSMSSGDDDFCRLVQLKTPSSPQWAALLVGLSLEWRR
jgi:hypothetical protein